MTSIIAVLPTSTAFGRLLRGLRRVFMDAASAGLPEEEPASELPPRLRYDVGLSDLCPDRMISARLEDASSDIRRELMRRGF